MRLRSDLEQPHPPCPAKPKAKHGSGLSLQVSAFTPHPSPFTPEQLRWLQAIKNTIALNGAFPTDETEGYLEAWQSVDTDEAVPLAVAKRAFGEDPKAIIEELNQALIAS